MSKQISNGTAFNIYYSENNIPYNNTDIKITGAKSGIIVCKDDLSYNLLFVNESGTPYLLSDDVNKFTGVEPIIVNNIKNGKEKEIKLNYDTSYNGLLTVNSLGQLMVDKNQLNENYASKNVEPYIDYLYELITSLQQENISLQSKIDILNKRFNGLNIDKDEYIPTNLDIWLNSYQDNKLCIRKKDNKDITYNYKLYYSGQTEINLYSTYSHLEVDKYNWNDNYDFIKQITSYTYSDSTPNVVQKNNNAYILIRNAYLKPDKYYYSTYSQNSQDLQTISISYFNEFVNTYSGFVGNYDLGNQRVSYAYDLLSDQININNCNKIDLQDFSNSKFADYPFEYIEDNKTFNTFNYYPVSYFSINKIDNFNIYDESPDRLKIICSYFDDNNKLKDAFYNIIIGDSNLYLDKHIKRLSSIRIYPCIYSYYGINSNLKLYSNDSNNITIQDIKPKTGSSYTISYTLNFDNVSYLEFKFSKESYNNKLNFTLSNLYLSTTNNKMDNTRANIFDLSIHKKYYINENTTSGTTSSTTPKPYSTTTSSTTPQPFNIFPDYTSTKISVVKIYRNDHDQINKDLYNNAQEWRYAVISNSGIVEHGKSISINIGKLIIDDEILPGDYYLNIYNNYIKLMNSNSTLELLTITPDGLVVFPTPNNTPKPTNPSLNITSSTSPQPINTQPPFNSTTSSTTSSTSTIPPNPTPDNTPDSKPDNGNKPNKPTLIITTSSTTSSTTPTPNISTTTSSLKPYNNA